MALVVLIASSQEITSKKLVTEWLLFFHIPIKFELFVVAGAGIATQLVNIHN